MFLYIANEKYIMINIIMLNTNKFAQHYKYILLHLFYVSRNVSLKKKFNLEE